MIKLPILQLRRTISFMVPAFVVGATCAFGADPYLGKVSNFAESVAVRDLPSIDKTRDKDAPGPDGRAINDENEIPIKHLDPNAKLTPDGALSKSAKDSNQTNLPNPPTVNFDGISSADTVAIGQGFLPPDTTGAVGPNHYVQAVNVAFRVWDKAGNPLIPTKAISMLFAPLGAPCGTRNDGDPIVLYDRMADRWLISQFCTATSPNNHQLIAISKTGDPTGDYWLYDFMMPNNKFNDYPHFGIWPDGYYMSDNQFNQAGTLFQQAGVFAFDRVKMIAGDPSATFVYFDTAVLFPPNVGINGPDGIGGILPADMDGLIAPAIGRPCPFAYFQANEFGEPADQMRFFDFHVDYATPGSSSFTERAGSPLPVAAFDPIPVPNSRNVVPQPSGSALDAIQDRLMFRLAYRNLGGSESLLVNHSVNAAVAPAYRAGVRWYQFNRATASSPWTIGEQETYTGPGGNADHRWMGSAAMNFQGDVAVGYSVSSTTVFPSIRYAARFGSDPVGTGLVQGEQSIIVGAGAQSSTSGRWGDYSAMTLDPTDDCTFWYTQEYYATSGSATWRTRIAKFVPGTQAVSPRGMITGVITNCATSAPVAGAIVRTTAGWVAVTDINGAYTMPKMAPGTYSVSVTKTGFSTATNNSVSVTNGGTATTNLCIGPLNIVVKTTGTVANAGPNGALDPGETVTVSLGVQNNGGAGACTVNLVGTIQPTGGVTNPVPSSQNYGALCAGAAAVSRDFTFRVDPTLACGSTVTVTLQLIDGVTNFGTVTYTFPVGTPRTALSENFDGVVPPALPASFTTDVTGTGQAWVTSLTTPDSAPNCAFAADQATVGVTNLNRASIAVTTAAAQLKFRNLFNLESGFDGMVLEIANPSVAAGAFQDIITAGGSFVTGGYTRTLSTGFSNPLPGRMAWSSLSAGTTAAPAYIDTVVNLPATAAGQTVQLRWRVGCDSSVTAAGAHGARIDTLTLLDGSVCAPIALTVVSRKSHNGPVFDVNLPSAGTLGVEPRLGTGPSFNQHQVVASFGGPVSVGSLSVTSSDGLATGMASSSGNTLTINLSNVANAQKLTVNLTNVNDGTNTGNVAIPMGILRGDGNGDGLVNSGDVTLTRSRSGQPTDSVNFRSDVNLDGTVNSGDLTIVRGQAGQFIP